MRESIPENKLPINQIAKGLLKDPLPPTSSDLYLTTLMLEIAMEEENQELMDLLTEKVMAEDKQEQMRLMWPTTAEPSPDLTREQIGSLVADELKSLL